MPIPTPLHPHRPLLQNHLPIRLLPHHPPSPPLHLPRLPPLPLLRLHKLPIPQIPPRPRTPPLPTSRRLIQRPRIPTLASSPIPADDPIPRVRQLRRFHRVVRLAEEDLPEVVEAVGPVAFVGGGVGRVVEADGVVGLELLDGVAEGVEAVELVEPGGGG